MPALDGMKVLDLTQYEAGTSCTQYLAWFGATVYKVERPGVGDPGRHVAGPGHDALYFLSFNHNKRSVALALDTPEGRQLFLDLVPRVDAVVENFSLGTMEDLGLGYEALKKVNPALIYATIKGFGTYGPYAEFRCFDRVAQAAGGSYSVTGVPDGPPMSPGATFGDTGSGIHLAMGILAAYIQRQRTGQGQLVEVSMQEAVASFMREPMSHREYAPSPIQRRGNRTVSPTDLYPCAPGGPNDWAVIFIATTRMWDALVSAIGRGDLAADPRFETGKERRQNGDALFEEIAAWTRQRTKFEVMEQLGQAGVPCGAVYHTDDILSDKHLAARHMIKTVHHPVAGDIQMLAPAVHMSASEVPMIAAPLLGQHTAEVLSAELGLDSARIKALAAAGAVGL